MTEDCAESSLFYLQRHFIQFSVLCKAGKWKQISTQSRSGREWEIKHSVPVISLLTGLISSLDNIPLDDDVDEKGINFLVNHHYELNVKNISSWIWNLSSN